ncbi:putative NAD(P)H oxidase (H(2)O(2)-forming) [Helianthus debilis subsp. tardiflorus]
MMILSTGHQTQLARPGGFPLPPALGIVKGSQLQVLLVKGCYLSHSHYLFPSLGLWYSPSFMRILHYPMIFFCYDHLAMATRNTSLTKGHLPQLQSSFEYTSQALSRNLHGLRNRSPIKRMSSKLIYYLQENWKRLWIISLWILIMTGLFLWKYYQYKQRAAFEVMGYSVLTAKGATEILKLNMAIILLPVCRNTITWLRSTRLSSFVPFDDNINFTRSIFFYCPTYVLARSRIKIGLS